jgi:aspartate/methionine/tyrosine aminotransferase
MTNVGSEYIRWAKSREHFRYNIGRSSIRPCPRSDFDPAEFELEVNGPNAQGWSPLREAIGDRYGVDAARVVLAIGTSMANHLVHASVLEPGDEVLVESPCYEPLRALAGAFRCHATRFERRREDGWRIDPDAVARALTPRTRLVVISDLHNPTGVRAGDEELEALADLAERRDLHLLVDEVYLEFLPVTEYRIAALRSDRLLSTCSLTKAYGLDGLRAGWIVTTAERAQALRDLNDLYGIIMPHPSEQLALHALQRIERLRASVARLVAGNRSRFERFLLDHPDLEWVAPAAGPIGFVRLRGPSVESLVDLLEREYDATLPAGRFFGAPDHFRVGFGMEAGDLEAGLDRLSSALSRLT